MNAIELTLLSKIAKYCADHEYEVAAINVSVNEKGVYLSFLEGAIAYFCVYAAGNFEEAKQWALDGRRNWRSIHKTVDSLMTIETLDFLPDSLPAHIADMPETINEAECLIAYLANEYDHEAELSKELHSREVQRMKIDILNNIAAEYPSERVGAGIGYSIVLTTIEGQEAYAEALREAGFDVPEVEEDPERAEIKRRILMIRENPDIDPDFFERPF